MEFNSTQIFVFGTIWSAIVGLIGWLGGRYGVRSDRKHAKASAKEARRRDSLIYLKQWESEVDIPYTPGPYRGNCVSPIPHQQARIRQAGRND